MGPARVRRRRRRLCDAIVCQRRQPARQRPRLRRHHRLHRCRGRGRRAGGCRGAAGRRCGAHDSRRLRRRQRRFGDAAAGFRGPATGHALHRRRTAAAVRLRRRRAARDLGAQHGHGADRVCARHRVDRSLHQSGVDCGSSGERRGAHLRRRDRDGPGRRCLCPRRRERCHRRRPRGGSPHAALDHPRCRDRRAPIAAPGPQHQSAECVERRAADRRRRPQHRLRAEREAAPRLVRDAPRRLYRDRRCFHRRRAAAVGGRGRHSDAAGIRQRQQHHRLGDRGALLGRGRVARVLENARYQACSEPGGRPQHHLQRDGPDGGQSGHRLRRGGLRQAQRDREAQDRHFALQPTWGCEPW